MKLIYDCTIINSVTKVTKIANLVVGVKKNPATILTNDTSNGILHNQHKIERKAWQLFVIATDAFYSPMGHDYHHTLL